MKFIINVKDFEIFRLRVKNKWLIYAKDFWWGDRLDSRFVASYYLRAIKDMKILDIGCNAGVVLSELDQSNFKVGLDKSSQALNIAKNLNKNALIIKGDMFDLPVKSSSFNIVISMGMLELVKADDKLSCLKEINRVLKKGGKLIITTPNRHYLSLLEKRNRIDYASLKELFSYDYEFEIYGFNPFPSFPFFLPNCIMERIPFIWHILTAMMINKVMLRYCRSFFVVASKVN